MNRKRNNPFDISFGRIPSQSVTRFEQSREILDAFLSDPSGRQIYMLTGIRGSGKTVLMNSIANELEEEKDWIVARLNPGKDLMHALGARLCQNRKCLEIFRNAKINLSLFGTGIELQNSLPVTDDETAVEQMLHALHKQNKRLLITIDEVTNNEYVRLFASSFQIFIGQNLPVFLLMTGLFENIDDLQNEKNLTFLYRAPKIRIAPLNFRGIAAKYQDILQIPFEQAMHMAGQTKGYSFAFQALGYAAWNHGVGTKACMDEYLQLLWESVYEKLWSELTPKEQTILNGLAHSPEGRIGEINAFLGLKPGEINQYRKRLIRKGIVDGRQHGVLMFTLPYFDTFIEEQSML